MNIDSSSENINKENQIDCRDRSIFLGSIGVSLFCFVIAFATLPFNLSVGWIFLVFAFIIACIFTLLFIYERKDKIENIVIAIITKERLGNTDSEVGPAFNYYFCTSTNQRYKICEELYHFLKENDTIEVIAKRDSISGLIKVIEE
jgi:hypothetical protein